MHNQSLEDLTTQAVAILIAVKVKPIDPGVVLSFQMTNGELLRITPRSNGRQKQQCYYTDGPGSHVLPLICNRIAEFC